LKLDQGLAIGGGSLIARPIPTKRELKRQHIKRLVFVSHINIARPIPTKRELKPFCFRAVLAARSLIARPIPTKRELKLPSPESPGPMVPHCKAHPDEKGIETVTGASGSSGTLFHCKAHPDEKGIETFLVRWLTDRNAA